METISREQSKKNLKSRGNVENMSLVNDLINTSLTSPKTHTHTHTRFLNSFVFVCVCHQYLSASPRTTVSSGIHMGFISPPSCNPSPNYFLFQFPEEVVKWFLNQTSFFSPLSSLSPPSPRCPTPTFTAITNNNVQNITSHL